MAKGNQGNKDKGSGKQSGGQGGGAKRVVSRQVAEAVAAVKAADNVVAVAARAINASHSHSIKQKG